MSISKFMPSDRASHRQAGFTLIELIFFIVIISILLVGLFAASSNALRGVGQMNTAMQAMQLARERMELILLQRRVLGFAGFTNVTYDPCTSVPPSTLPPCTGIPAGYVVAPAYGPDWGGDTNYRVVSVTVTGSGSATLTALVADY